MASKHILVFEPDANGHQMDYLRYLLASMDQGLRNIRVTLLTTAEASSHPNCRRLAEDFSRLVTIRIAALVAEGNRLFRALGIFYENQWRNAETLSRGLEEI